MAFLWSGGGDSFEDLLSRFPALATRLDYAPVETESLGAGPLHQGVSAVHTERIALVGDAAGYVDAITGEGLALGFLQARAAVKAITAGDLRAYGRAHRKLTRQPFALMRLLLWVKDRPKLRRRLMRAVPAAEAVRSHAGSERRRAPVSSIGFPAMMRFLGSAVRSE